MPEGNAHFLPSGIWSRKPNPDSYPKLVLRTCRHLSLLGLGIWAYGGFRYMQSYITYPKFHGKSLIFGRMTVLDHKPLSVEEVDKLKAAQAERRRIARMKRRAGIEA